MTDMERFMAKVSPEPNSGCWLWLGAISTNGYGQIWNPQTRALSVASRWIYEAIHGPIADGLYVCHQCDVSLCVNPAHLFLGTPTDNVRDCMGKGRFRSILREKMICLRGHPLQGENVRMYSGGKKRRCLVCDRIHDRRKKDKLIAMRAATKAASKDANNG